MSTKTDYDRNFTREKPSEITYTYTYIYIIYTYNVFIKTRQHQNKPEPSTKHCLNFNNNSLTNQPILHCLRIYGSGGHSGKILLVRIIENNEINAHFRSG